MDNYKVFKDACISGNGKLTEVNNKVIEWHIVMPHRYHKPRPTIRTLFHRIKCWITRMPFIPNVKEGWYRMTFVKQVGCDEILTIFKPVNPDGSEIESGYAYGEMQHIYSVVNNG